MALYAVVTNVLRDSVVYLVALSKPEAAELETIASPISLIVFWAVFAFLILLALYLALIDLRYIRFQYLAEKREIFGRTVGDEAFRKSLLRKPADDA